MLNEKVQSKEIDSLQNNIDEFTYYAESHNKKVFIIDNDCKYAKEISPDEFISKFVQVCEKAIDTKKRKGHDYGNTFESTYADYGLLSIIARYRDKLGRIENLLKGSMAQVKDESIKDTILDLGNYCFMTYALMECIDDYKESLKTKIISNPNDIASTDEYLPNSETLINNSIK